MLRATHLPDRLCAMSPCCDARTFWARCARTWALPARATMPVRASSPFHAS